MANYQLKHTGAVIDDAIDKALTALQADTVGSVLQTAKDSGEFDGKDGTSVTVANVSESAEDGGSNVVTFSDGKKLTVKNGTKGANGKTPVKGVDYVDGTNGVGIQSVEQTTTSTADGGSNVITVTKTDGSKSTFIVKNGSKGSQGYTPVKGKDYFDGDDGVSPTVTITTITGGHRVSITDASGTKSFDVMNGAEISDTKLAEAIAAYIAENPIEGGVDEEQLAQAVETALQTAKDSGEFDGPQGPPGLNWRGEWVESVGYQKNDAVSRNGTSYVLVDSSFPSSEKPEEHPNSWAVLAQKGDSGASGVYIGPDAPTDPSVNVWIDPDGDPSGYEEWVFTLSDGSTVTKQVVVLA